MRFSLSGSCEPNPDGTWTWRLDPSVPNGQTVTYNDVAQRLLIPALARFNELGNTRISTVAEMAAMETEYRETCAPPSGWSPSLDGANLVNDAFTKRFLRADGAECVAPVGDPNGTSVPATRQALLTYDAEHPPQTPAAEA